MHGFHYVLTAAHNVIGKPGIRDDIDMLIRGPEHEIQIDIHDVSWRAYGHQVEDTATLAILVACKPIP